MVYNSQQSQECSKYHSGLPPRPGQVTDPNTNNRFHDIDCVVQQNQSKFFNRKIPFSILH